MTKTSSVREDFVKPIVVLTLICLVCAALLAYLNSVTRPIIEKTEADIAEAARSEVLPDSGGFTLLDVALPEGSFVTEVTRPKTAAATCSWSPATATAARGP